MNRSCILYRVEGHGEEWTWTGELVHGVNAVFCQGYLEWWLDSNLHIVLFIQYILNTISILSERWLIMLSGGYSQPVWAEH